MQRRAAAIYAALFLVIAAGSYAVIGVAEQPTVSVDDPAHSLSAGDTLPAGDRTYTVGSVAAATNEGDDLRSVELTWVNESARYTAEIEDNATVPARNVEWDGQRNRETARLADGSTVDLDGTEYRVVTAPNASPPSVTFVGGESNRSVEIGDQLRYRGNRATVLSVDAEAATLVWGEPYRLLVENATDPSAFTLTQEFNVSARLSADPAVENQTVTRADGSRYVVYRSNGSTRPLSTYLPEPEQRTFGQGDTVVYRGNASTVATVSNESVQLAWIGPRTNARSLAEGDVTTIGGTEYVAHFPDNGTLELSTDTEAYANDAAAVETYHERINGFWGISILSGLASVLLVGAAYLPSRY